MLLDKWVKNLSGVPLSDAPVSLLANGPSFAISLRHLHGEYISALKLASQNLEPRGTEGLRAEIRGDLTNKLKNNAHQPADADQSRGASPNTYTRRCTLQGAVSPKFYGLPKIQKRDITLDIFCLVGVPSVMKWPKG